MFSRLSKFGNSVCNTFSSCYNYVKSGTTRVYNAAERQVCNTYKAAEKKVTYAYNVVDQKVTNFCNVVDQKVTYAYNVVDQKATNICNVVDQKVTNFCNVVDQKFTNTYNIVEKKLCDTGKKICATTFDSYALLTDVDAWKYTPGVIKDGAIQGWKATKNNFNSSLDWSKNKTVAAYHGIKNYPVDAYNWSKNKCIDFGHGIKNYTIAAYNWSKNKCINFGHGIKNYTVDAYNWSRNKTVDAYNWSKNKYIASKLAVTSFFENLGANLRNISRALFPIANPAKLSESELMEKQADLYFTASTQFSHRLGALSECVYSTDKIPMEQDGFKRIPDYDRKNGRTGFQGNVFEDENSVVIVFTGTEHRKGCKELSKDILNDALLVINASPTQLQDAKNLYLEVLNDPRFKGKKIYLTGHSLGGSLAQLIVGLYNEQHRELAGAITFNAYGVKTLTCRMNKITDRKNLYPIVNYVSENDFISNSSRHPGKVIYAQGANGHTIMAFRTDVFKKSLFAENKTKPSPYQHNWFNNPRGLWAFNRQKSRQNTTEEETALLSDWWLLKKQTNPNDKKSKLEIKPNRHHVLGEEARTQRVFVC